MPKIINGWFSIGKNPNLKSLEGAPERILKDFYADYCDIQDLGSTLKYVGGNFWINYQKTKQWTEEEIRAKIEIKEEVYI